MGIHIPTMPKAPGNCYCFASGQTPLYIYATVSGMAKGNFWFPGLPVPPNGSYRLTWGDGCSWSGVFGDWGVGYSSAPLGAFFGISRLAPPLEDSFMGYTASCQGGFTNLQDNPAAMFWYGGSAQVTWKPPSPSPSLANIMNEVISENFEGWKAEVTPFSEEVFVARMANRNGKSCVHVKYNPYL